MNYILGIIMRGIHSSYETPTTNSKDKYLSVGWREREATLIHKSPFALQIGVLDVFHSNYVTNEATPLKVYNRL
jgi:hypothetical protein